MSTQRAGPASIGLRGRDIRLRAADGHEFGAYRCDPDRVPVGRLVVLQEIFGVNRHIREVCDRFAGLGYATLSPALFDRSRPDTQLGYDPEDIETGRQLRAAIEWADTLRDVQTALDELKGDGPVAALGWPMMRDKNWGRIVSMIGGAGKEPDPYMFGSGMTNSALLNMTKSLSTEFAPHNVLVNAVCPGWVATDLWKRNESGLQKELGVASKEEARQLAAKKNALGRFGRPEELANAIVFLCSERASYITGVSLNLDGGRLKGLW